MSSHYVDQYGDSWLISVLCNKTYMLAVWATIGAIACLTAYLGADMAYTSRLALWSIFVECILSMVFGLYRSLFYNFLAGLTLFVAVTISLPGLLFGHRESVDVGLRLFAMLMGCFSFTGIFIVLSMVVQFLSINRNNA